MTTDKPEMTAEECPTKADGGKFNYMNCPHMKEVGGGWEGEKYSCEKCGQRYFLDYEDMK